MRVNLATAAAITGMSDRTLRRWIAEGTIERGGGVRTMIELDSLAGYVRLELDDDSRAVIAAADRGDPDGENNLALLFLAAQQHGRAAFWLERAAAQGHTDAMHWLARCHFEGRGAPKDSALGLMWLAKAASQGHAISAQQLTKLVRMPLAMV